MQEEPKEPKEDLGSLVKQHEKLIDQILQEEEDVTGQHKELIDNEVDLVREVRQDMY